MLIILAITISIHAPVWGATSSFFISSNFDSISIHAPVWGATPRTANIRDMHLTFQFTLPCGERRSGRTTRATVHQFQFTLPCGERHNLFYYFSVHVCISIHAPVWGATGHVMFFVHIIEISIHAPVWGATVLQRNSEACNRYFNSRSRVGSDLFPVEFSLYS